MAMEELNEAIYKSIEGALVHFGNAIDGAAELVAFVRRPGGAGTVVSNYGTIEDTIEALRKALAFTMSAKEQLDAGVAHTGGSPPTMQ